MVEIDAETCNLIKKHATKDTVKGALAAINAANDKDSDPNVTCSICYQMLHVPNPDGDVEKAVMFPCGHIFGHLCLMQVSLNACSFMLQGSIFIDLQYYSGSMNEVILVYLGLLAQLADVRLDLKNAITC